MDNVRFAKHGSDWRNEWQDKPDAQDRGNRKDYGHRIALLRYRSIDNKIDSLTGFATGQYCPELTSLAQPTPGRGVIGDDASTFLCVAATSDRVDAC